MRWLLLALGALAACGEAPPAPYPGPLDLPAATVVEVNTTVRVPGRYNVRAAVVEMSECPPCPRGAQCQPCERNGVLVADGRPPDLAAADATSLFIWARDADQFRVGRRYTFLVDLEAPPPQAPSLRKATLLGYGPAE